MHRGVIYISCSAITYYAITDHDYTIMNNDLWKNYGMIRYKTC